MQSENEEGPLLTPGPPEGLGNGEEAKNEESEDDRLQSLEDRIKQLESTLEEQEEGDSGDGEDEPVLPDYPTMEIGGRVHLDGWFFPETDRGIDFFENPATGVDPEDRLFFRRIRLEMEGEVSPTMIWRMQIDFNSPEDPEMKDVYLGFDELPGNQALIIGNQKRPLGLDHLNSSRFNVFMERPLVVEAFNEDARRLGVAMRGHSDDLVYNWQYGLFSLENIRDDGTYIGDSLQFSGNARLASSPWYDETSGGRGYLHLAMVGMVAHPEGDVSPLDANENEGRFRTRAELRSDQRWIDTGRIPGADWYEIAGVETIFNAGPLQVVGEYQNSWMQRDDTTPGTGPDLFFHGGYVYVSYILTGEHIPYDRDSGTIARLRPFENFFLVDQCHGPWGAGWGAWGVAARLSYLDLTDHDIRGGVERNLTLGLNWYWTPYSKLQFNTVIGKIDDHRPVGGFTQGDFIATGFRFQIDF